ncbi:MAG: hypothetical protein IJY27_06240 [Clostridia bacterium]|nr:hypothetical protein [Clostridia bacterium]
MRTSALWTIGAFAAGVAAAGAIGAMGMRAAMIMSERHGIAHRHYRHKRYGHVSPVDDMDKMSSDVHGMVAEVVSHECGHLG